MENKIKDICCKFNIKGTYKNYEVLTSGHINTTYKVDFINNENIESYILQKINTYVFKNPVEVMENIFSVTSHIKNKLEKENIDSKRNVLNFLECNNKPYIYDDETSFYRCYKFIDNSITFNETNDLKVIEESGKAFGKFQSLLSDYPVKKLNIVIPHFHNTVNRYELFKESIKNNYSNRKDTVLDVIEEYLSLEEVATRMYKMQKYNKLPLRVTHNDTKCNNVLFDKDTHNHLAVIDLDTVMPGLVGFDFGDAIRFIGNTCKEDEKDLDKVTLDLDKYNAFYKGFTNTLKDNITQTELETLPLGAITMTIECGMRFLTDYLDGDKYFKTSYPEHNLVRSKCQLKLAKEMIKKLRY